MPEKLLLNHQFVDVLKSAIEPGQAELNELMFSETGRASLDAILPINPLANAGDLTRRGNTVYDIAAVLHGEQEASASEQTHIFRCINQSVFLWDKAVGESAPFDIFPKALIRQLKKGADGMLKVIDKSETCAEYSLQARDQAKILLPYYLMRLVRTASENLHEDDEEASQRLAADFSLIMEGNKLGNPGHGADSEVYVRALNMLSALYKRPHDNDYVNRVVSIIGGELDQALYADNFKLLAGTSLTSQVSAMIADCRQKMYASGLKFGIEPIRLSNEIDRYMQSMSSRSRAPTKSTRKAAKTADSITAANELMITVKNENQNKIDQITQSWQSKRKNVRDEVYRTTIARSLIDGRLDGTFDQATINKMIAVIYSRPLADIAKPELESQDETLEWEVLPPGNQDDLGPAPSPKSAEGKNWEIDPTRLDQLKSFITLWGEGYIARSKIAGLSPDMQYYVAVLPQRMSDGTVLEHAISDNLQTRHHAAYVWRAERGIGRYGQVQRTWREVFRDDKAMAKQRGAKAIKHTETFDAKIMEYMTRPEHLLHEQRYYFSLGKRAVKAAQSS